MGSFGNEMKNVDEILDKLTEIDLMCEQNEIYAEILILGGAGLLLIMEMQGDSFRSTRDIDINLISSTDEKGFREVLKRFEVDILDGIIEVPPPEDFEDEEKYKITNTGFKNLEVFVPKIELLACTKIFSVREKDLQDLKDTNLLMYCNKKELLEMIDEYKNYYMNIDNPDLNYRQLFSILRDKGI